MEFKAKQIAELLCGKIEGDENTIVNDMARIEEGKPGTITFLANPKYETYIYNTKASIAIVNSSFKPEKPLPKELTLIKVENAYESLAQLLSFYDSYKSNKIGIETPSFISTSAKVGENVYIGAFSYIGERVTIGSHVKIYPNTYIGDNVNIGNNSCLNAGVKIYANTEIGDSCTIHSGAVIGADGFGFVPNSENNYQKVPQIGNVIIEDHVEIGANTTIDRATIGSTIIKKGVKLDNLIQIAHNVELGENTVIAAQTGISGSVKVGKDVMIGGQVGMAGHLKIADKVKIAAQSGVGKDIKNENEIVQGSPSFNIGDYKRSYVLFRNLPKLKQDIDSIKKDLKELNNE
jgi:UDP-3-O-[3-hydroxymyristoyl] glucosamine N-acyltransferase